MCVRTYSGPRVLCESALGGEWDAVKGLRQYRPKSLREHHRPSIAEIARGHLPILWWWASHHLRHAWSTGRSMRSWVAEALTFQACYTADPCAPVMMVSTIPASSITFVGPTFACSGIEGSEVAGTMTWVHSARTWSVILPDCFASWYRQNLMAGVYDTKSSLIARDLLGDEERLDGEEDDCRRRGRVGGCILVCDKASSLSPQTVQHADSHMIRTKKLIDSEVRRLQCLFSVTACPPSDAVWSPCTAERSFRCDGRVLSRCLLDWVFFWSSISSITTGRPFLRHKRVNASLARDEHTRNTEDFPVLPTVCAWGLRGSPAPTYVSCQYSHARQRWGGLDGLLQILNVLLGLIYHASVNVSVSAAVADYSCLVLPLAWCESDGGLKYVHCLHKWCWQQYRLCP